MFRIVQPSHKLVLEYLYLPLPKKAHTRHYDYPFIPKLPSYRQLPMYFLSTKICLFFIFHVSGPIEYVVFWDCIFFTLHNSSRFIHVVACIRTSFLFMNG